MSESKNAATQTCCHACDCGTCSCNCGAGTCSCRVNNCRCGCRNPVTPGNTKKTRKLVLGLALVAAAVANASAKEPNWQTGRLVGLDTRTTAVSEEIRNGHYEERQAKNGKTVIAGNSYAVNQAKVTYVLTVRIGDTTYTAEHLKNLFFGYNPTDMVVNDPVTVSVQKNKLVLIRPDGKQYKATIVRIEHNVQRTE